MGETPARENRAYGKRAKRLVSEPGGNELVMVRGFHGRPGSTVFENYFVWFVFVYKWGLRLATVEDRMIIKTKKVFETFFL